MAARYESFRAAGEELFITASAVSHQVKSIEEELGKPLFDRTSRDLRLTEPGRTLYEEVSPLIGQVDAAVAKIRNRKAASSIRISVQPFFASEYFIPRLSQFTELHPEIDIQVNASDESSEKHPATADLSVRLFRTPPDNLESKLLFPLRLVPAGSPEFKGNVVVKKKAIVSEFPLIVHESYPKAWSEWSTASGIVLPDNARTTRLDSMIAVVRAAQRGIGAALVPVPVGDLWFAEGSIVRLFKQELVSDSSYYLVCRKDREGNESLQLFRRWILQNFAGAD